MSAAACPTPEHQVTVMKSAARCVAKNDANAARALLRGCSFVRRFLEVKCGRPSLKNAAEFSEAFEATSGADLERQRSALHFKARSRAACLQRKAALWSKSQPKAILAGVILKSGEIATTRVSQTEALSKHWAQVFKAKVCDESAMQKLAQFVPPLPEIPPPSKRNMREALRRTKQSAPGSDGLPAAAWQQLGEVAVELLFESACWQMSGLPPPPIMNSCSLVCPPKKVKSSEGMRVQRKAKDTRPIALKNVFPKICLAGINFGLKSVLPQWSTRVQRGFVPGRQLVANVVEADAWGRIYSMEASAADHPKFMAHRLRSCVSEHCQRVGV